MGLNKWMIPIHQDEISFLLEGDVQHEVIDLLRVRETPTVPSVLRFL